jgi:hypothetical protein
MLQCFKLEVIKRTYMLRCGIIHPRSVEELPLERAGLVLALSFFRIKIAQKGLVYPLLGPPAGNYTQRIV